MKALLPIAVMLAAMQASAQTAASVCGSLMMSDDKVRCIQMVNGHVVEPGAASVCATIMMSSDKAECLRGALDKHYEPDELTACRSVMMGSDKVSCIAGAGQPFRQQRPPGPGSGPAPTRRDDDDEDDDSDSRTIRLTNYHAGTISRVFWKRPKDRSFQEIKLRNVIATNQYDDFSVPDESVAICLQTPDGFRLHWAKIKRSEAALTIANDERNWGPGKCRDLR